MEEGGDPLPHLSALDPILAELAELETSVKKAPKEEVEDARCGSHHKLSNVGQIDHDIDHVGQIR